jgi:hypothetical protein
VAQSCALCRLLSGYAIAVELAFPLALLSPVTAAACTLAAVGMHLGARGLMGIDYLRYWWPNYLPFLLPVAQVLAR